MNNSFDILNLSNEVQENILSYFDLRTLLKLRESCRHFHQILSRDKFWRNILIRRIGREKLSLLGLTPNVHLEWKWSFVLAKHGTLGKNLLNRDEMYSYRFSNYMIGKIDNEWLYEFCADIPKEACVSYCYTVKDFLSEKYGVIDLWKCGFPSEFLDEFQPKIKFGEWFFNSYNHYSIIVSLLDDHHQDIKEESFYSEIKKRGWMAIHREIINYGPGLRYIKYYHFGRRCINRNCQGIKIAGSYLSIAFKDE